MLEDMGTSYKDSSVFEANLYWSLIRQESKPHPLLKYKDSYSSSSSIIVTPLHEYAYLH